MKWKLWLDDQLPCPARFSDGPWIICRNYYDAIFHIKQLGPPCEISFDHDLGLDNETGKDFADYLIKQDLNYRVGDGSSFHFIEEFVYSVHSANPVGAQNIREVMNQYLKQIKS